MAIGRKGIGARLTQRVQLGLAYGKEVARFDIG